ncbi:glycosyltransferase [Acinetobacter wanghuae]|uniref:Glycosyltransferase n=1 Tax=Acinetobacter wanghuae TaxID=2662362 RepID=A0A5Q0P4Q6_9GAMM|nr:glycosyltransferase family 4 protein [Acinetobacter wanghuae]MQW92628.1 glycosyltransferase [Acinetobacter wanghuae]QGA12187.1 glycosyltransferase [Acinetobacter wanghuae]
MSKVINTAVVADWLVTYAGAERVLCEMLKTVPHADLFAVIDFIDETTRKKYFQGKLAQTTFIQHLPFAQKKYRNYLPFMPYAIEQLDVSKYDVVISSSHAVAKGILTGPDQLHISYVHSPIRYAWDLQHQYLNELNLNKGLKSLIIRWLLHKIRMWDYRTSNGVDHFVANSKFIARRIKKVYGREADIIYPPVNTDIFQPKDNKDNYYVTASRMVPYKKIDLIVESFSHMKDKKLVVIGDGPDMEKIKAKASSNIEILGYQNNDVMQEYMRNAKAFVFAAEEDFGITPVEAQACGTPIIAFGKGGALETVVGKNAENPTGVFFEEQKIDSLIKAISSFEREQHIYTPENCRLNALKFSTDRFNQEFSKYIEDKWNLFQISNN